MRPSATKPASAASATRPCRSTRRSCRPWSTCPAVPTACTPGSPRASQYVALGGGTAGVPYLGSLTRHLFETIAFHAHLGLHVRVLAGRDPHHIVEAQFKAFARALRDAVAHRPARGRVCRGRRAPCEPWPATPTWLSSTAGAATSAPPCARSSVPAPTVDPHVRPGGGTGRPTISGHARASVAYAAVHEGAPLDPPQPVRIARRLAGGRPVLGICVGMQILFERGIEHGVETEGCGEWPGAVERIPGSDRAAHGLEHRRRTGSGSRTLRGDRGRALLLRALLRGARLGR